MAQDQPDTYWSQRVPLSGEDACGRFLFESFKAGHCKIVDVKESGAVVFGDLGADGDDNERSVAELKRWMKARATGVLSDTQLRQLMQEPMGFLFMVRSLPSGIRVREQPQPSLQVRQVRATAAVEATDHPRIKMETRHRLVGDGSKVYVELHGLNKAQALLLVSDALQMHGVTQWTLCVGTGVEHGPLRLAPLLEQGLKLRGYAVSYARPVLQVQLRASRE